MNSDGAKKIVPSRIWLIPYLALLFIVIAAGLLVTGYLGNKAKQEILEYNDNIVSSHSDHLIGKFEKIEGGVTALSGSPWIAPALISRKEQDIANANSVLDRYNASIGSSVCYLMDSNGITIASSNRNASDSFVGKSYQFRPYFIQAIKGAPGRYFALGATSFKRGFYASYPVKDSKGKIIGIAVIKEDIDSEESHLVKYPNCFVVDPNGIIFLSSKKEMNLKSLWPVDREIQHALIKSKQFGTKEFEAILPREAVDGTEVTFDGKNHLASRKVINSEGWSIVLMTRTERVIIYKAVGVIITIFMLTLVVVPLIINFQTSRLSEKVRESEIRFRMLFQNLTVGFALHEIILNDEGQPCDYRFLEVNPAFEQLTGLKAQELIGRTVLDVMPGTEPDWIEKYGHVALTGDPLRFENYSSELGRFYECLAYSPRHGQFAVLFTDITERKRATEALRESEGLLREAQKVAQMGHWELDTSIMTPTWSEEIFHIFGLDPEEDEPSFEAHQKVTHPDDWGILNNAVTTSIAEGTPFDIEFRILLPDKTVRWMHSIGYPKKDSEGRIISVFGTAQNITNSKLMENELKESEERYKALFERSLDLVYLCDFEGNFIDANNTALELLGYTNKDIKSLNFSSLLTDDQIPLALEQVDEILKIGSQKEVAEFKLRRKDGNYVYVESLGAIIYKEGKPYAIQGIARNITDRKHAEEEKRSLAERLNRAEKMESLGLLAGGVAHDLNNVLGIVVGYAELLLFKANESSAIRPQLEEIMKGGQKAASIVDDLLTLARRGVSGRNIINLNKIITDNQKSPEFTDLFFHHSDVKIKTDLEPELLNISGSTVHLGKTIFNLVSNASEAMPKGGVLTIKTANRYLDKPVHGYDQIQEGDYVMLSVSDTGEGIPEADLKRIFEPFYTKKVMGRSGTGLGLAVVWGTVKDHNGYINVQSEEGKGSTFTLYFPVTREELSVDHVAVPISEYMGKGESILIVDDVKGQRYLAEEMLKKLNYRVSSVSSGEEAVAYLKEHKADLMVLDMIMDPGMDGLDTYRSVLEIRPKQKAIIVSGFSESDRVKAARVLGAGAYVRKPYVIEKLGLAVRKELDRST